jgi:hypothetical protein
MGFWTLLVLLVVTLAWALPRTVQGGDAAEFSVVMLRGGIAHPSGYPWMRLLSLLAWMPESLGMSPASAAALLPASFGAAAWLLWYRILSRWVHAALACFWCALAGTCALSVEHLYDAEVWGPHLFFTALFVNLCTREEPPRALLLGLLLGAATAHHLTAVLLVPLAISSAWPEEGQPLASGLVRNAAAGIGGSLLGLSAFVSLRIAAPSPADSGWTWGEFDTWAGWFHHISRGDYGTTQLSLHESEATALEQILRAWQSVCGNLSGQLASTPLASILLFAALLALAAHAARDRLPRRTRLGYAGCLLTTLVFFPSLADLDPTRAHSTWILERFDFLPMALLMGVAALACEGIRLQVASRQTRAGPRLRGGAAYLAGGSLLAYSALSALAHPPSADHGVEAYARALYATPDPAEGRSIVFGTDDHRSFPAVFHAEVLEPDSSVLYIDPSLMSYPWYQKRVYARWPELPREHMPVRMIMAMLADPQFADTPIYLANYFSGPSHTIPVVPQGVLMRLWNPAQGDPREHARTLLTRHSDALERIRASGVRAHDFQAGARGHGVWSGDLLWSFADRQRELALLLQSAGQEELLLELQREAVHNETPGASLVFETPGSSPP